MTQKKQLKLGQGQPDSLTIREAFTSGVFSHPSLSVSRVHEGICGNHIGARALAGKVLRQGYY